MIGSEQKQKNKSQSFSQASTPETALWCANSKTRNTTAAKTNAISLPLADFDTNSLFYIVLL